MSRTSFLVLFVAFLRAAPIAGQAATGDEWLKKPVDDRTFQAFLPFFAYDKSVPFDVRRLERDEVDGLAREHVGFQSTPGQRVTARIYKAATVGTRPGWIVYLHGGGALGKDGASTAFLAGYFAKAGWNVLAIDMLHFGERKTDVLTQFTEPEKHDRLYNQPAAYLAWVSQTVKDAGRSVDFLVKEQGADPARIVVLGFSRGAQMASVVGAAEKRFAAVVMLYGGHFDGFETQHLPAACPANYIGRISPRPLLMLNGTQDTDFQRETAVLPLQRLAGNPHSFLWAETGHSVPPVQLMPQVTKWIAENVK